MSTFTPFPSGGGSGSGGEDMKPESTVQTSGAYTVPAGKWAIVKATCESADTLIIDGTTVMQSRSWSNLASSNINHFSGNQYVEDRGVGSVTGNSFNSSTAYNVVSGEFKVLENQVIAGSAMKHIEIYPA